MLHAERLAAYFDYLLEHLPPARMPGLRGAGDPLLRRLPPHRFRPLQPAFETP
ncbi:Uncharacterised protein [Amycolatopsis camponoti]|uniref:Uncharacterized protein n=1 Tax=Amycolatopsis camponoti TaxID=2606593 RepID=A0A6I8LZ80_9PSEU|nr:Uncharacterised protein [Amycolatopsis camponoti]